MSQFKNPFAKLTDAFSQAKINTETSPSTSTTIGQLDAKRKKRKKSKFTNDEIANTSITSEVESTGLCSKWIQDIRLIDEPEHSVEQVGKTKRKRKRNRKNKTVTVCSSDSQDVIEVVKQKLTATIPQASSENHIRYSN